MRKLHFLHLSGSTPIDISASQNGTTASTSVQPELWGGPISINVERSALGVAPESTHFSVDLSQSIFDTPESDGAAPHYKPRFHELSYFWDFGTGETDLYEAPDYLLDEWRKANIAYGPEVSKMFTTPGTYEVKLHVLERSSGRSSDATVTITVEDPDGLFVGHQTHVVAHDGDFTGAPNGAILHTDLPAAIAALTGSGATHRRLLLKRGGTYTLTGPVTVNFSMTDHFHVGAWGSGARPIITTSDTASPTYMFYFVGNNPSSPRRDVRFSDVDFQGSWDPLTATGSTSEIAIFSLHSLNLMVSNCTSRNVGTFCLIQGNQGAVATANRTHLHELAIEEFKSYPLFFGPLQNSRVAFTGVRVAQNPDAYSNWPAGVNSNGGAPVRINGSHTYIDGCDFFSHNSHGSSDQGYPQPCLRLNDRPTVANDDLVTVVEGTRLNVQRCALESGGQSITLGAGDINNIRSVTVNALFDKLISVGGHSTRPFIRSYNGGVTVRNSFFILPQTPFSGIALDQGFVWFQIAPTGGTPDLTAQHSPNMVYNNTFVNLRSDAQNNGFSPNKVSNAVGESNGENKPASSPAFQNMYVNNNIHHMPHLTPPVVDDMPQQDQTPLTITPQSGAPATWYPRNKGRRIPSTGEMQTQFGTSGEIINRYVPTGTSPAAGQATGRVSHRDIRGKERVSYPNKGAWDVI